MVSRCEGQPRRQAIQTRVAFHLEMDCVNSPSATKRRPMDLGHDSAPCFLLSIYCCIPLQRPLVQEPTQSAYHQQRILLTFYEHLSEGNGNATGQNDTEVR